MIHKV